MLMLIVKRLCYAIPTLFFVTFAVFMLTALIPGDPAVTLAGGPSASPARVQEIRDELRLDDPVVERYAHWLGDVVNLDFGRSLANNERIGDAIGAKFTATLSVVLGAAAVALLIGTPLGVATGFKPGGVLDAGARVFANLSVAVPSFLLGPWLVVVFAVDRRWLPPSGFIPLSQDPAEWFRRIMLPSISLGLFLAASLSRQLRSAVIDVMDRNFVRTLWANGAKRRTILFKHVLRSAASPALTIFALSIGALLGGSVIVEQIFGIQGLGSYMFGAILSRDIPIIQAMTIVFVVTQLAVSLIIDMAQAVLNPRLREG